MKFKNTPIIKTDRLCLRAVDDSDREGLIELLKNEEIGKTFTAVLEDAGVYKRTPDGIAAFLRFIATIR